MEEQLAFRHGDGERWTEARLAELCESRGDVDLIIVSNRAPYRHGHGGWRFW